MVAAASAQIQLTNCATNDDCRTYEDTTATCVSNACACTSPDTSEFCSGNSTGTTGVSYTFSFNYDCDNFFKSLVLQEKIRLTIEKTISTGEITFDITFTCGSLIVLVAGDVPVGTVATVGADLTTALETGLVGTEMENTLTASGAQVDAGTSVTTCKVTSPATSAVYIEATQTCVVTGCNPGYQVQTNAPTYVATCVELTSETDSDDDLSTGAIIAIVFGCVGFVALVLAAIFILLGKKADPPAVGEQTNNNKNVSGEPFADVDV